MIRIVAERTRRRTYVYTRSDAIEEHEWTPQNNAIDAVVFELTPEAAEQYADVFVNVVRGEAVYGIQDAYWRLVATVDNATVETTGGPVRLPGFRTQRVVLTPAYSALNVPDRVVLDLSELQSPLPADEDQPELPIDTSVPSGTVVQILDEWGDPIDSTEVI